VASVISAGNNKNLIGKKSSKHKQNSSLDGNQDSEASQATVVNMIRTQNIQRGSTGIHDAKMPGSTSSKKATS